MSRRPGESAAAWFERAIATHSVAATQQETFTLADSGNPAAWDAISQRFRDTAVDLQQAEAAYIAERDEQES